MGDVPPSESNSFRGAGEKNISVTESQATISSAPGKLFDDCSRGGDVTPSKIYC